MPHPKLSIGFGFRRAPQHPELATVFGSRRAGVPHSMRQRRTRRRRRRKRREEEELHLCQNLETFTWQVGDQMIVLLSCTGAKFRNPENGFRHGFAVHPGSTKLRNTYYLLVPLLHCADLVSFGECTMAPCKYTMKMLGSASKLPLSLFKSHGTWMFFLCLDIFLN